MPGDALATVCVVVWHGLRVRVEGDVLVQAPPTRSHRDMGTIRVVAEAIQQAETIVGIGATLRSSAIGEIHRVELLSADGDLLVRLHRRATPRRTTPAPRQPGDPGGRGGPGSRRRPAPGAGA